MYMSWLIPERLRAKQCPCRSNKLVDNITQVHQSLVFSHTIQCPEIRIIHADGAIGGGGHMPRPRSGSMRMDFNRFDQLVERQSRRGQVLG